MKKRTLSIGLSLLLNFSPTGYGQATPPPDVSLQISPQEKAMSARAAELDAYRQLAERIMGLQIRAGTTVRDFVTADDHIATAVDQFIKGVRLSAPRYFDDGTAEVDAEVTLEQVITRLKHVYDEFYKGDQINKSDFNEISRHAEYTILKVTGSGAVRAQSNVPDPASQAVVTTSQTQHINLPAIYRQYPPAERLKARRAAELDAYRKLMERIYGLQISARTHVRDFVTESDQIRAATEGYLRGVRTMDVRYGDDGIVEVTMAVTVEQVITAVKHACDEVYKGDHWSTSEFDQITHHTDRKVITVIGTGALDTTGAGKTDDTSNTVEQGSTESIVVQ